MAEEIIKARIVFDTSGLGSIGKIAGASGGGNSGSIGGFAVGGAVGGAVAAGVQMLVSVAKKTFDLIKKSSPALQATFDIFSKGVMLMLRPIADIMNMWLRPMAMSFLKYAIKFYKEWKDFFTGIFGKKTEKPSDQTTSQVTEDARNQADDIAEQMGLTGTAGEMFVNTLKVLEGAWNILIAVLEGAAAFVILFAKAGMWLADKALTPLMPLINALVDVFVAFSEWIRSVADALLQFALGKISFDELIAKLGEALLTFLTDFSNIAVRFVEEYKQMFLDVLNWVTEMGTKLWNGIKSLWNDGVNLVKNVVGSLVSWVSDKFTNLVQFIGDALSSVRDFFLVTVPSWFQSVVDKINSVWEKIKIFFGGGSGGTTKPSPYGNTFFSPSGKGSVKVKDAVITPQGTVYTDPNDFLIATKNPAGLGGGTNNITVNVNALDSSSIDNNTINKIVKAIDEKLKRGYSSRTTEFFGN